MADWSQFNPWAAPRFADFIRSPNIEDRRNEHYLRTREVGPFGTTGEAPNVFESGGGTMVNLDPEKDFIQVGGTPAGNALGLNDLMDMLRQYGLAGPSPFTNTQEPKS